VLTAPTIEASTVGTSGAKQRDLVPAPIWIEDWSSVTAFCEQQRAAGILDLRSLLEARRAIAARHHLAYPCGRCQQTHRRVCWCQGLGRPARFTSRWAAQQEHPPVTR
jgi:hypothetical protein